MVGGAVRRAAWIAAALAGGAAAFEETLVVHTIANGLVAPLFTFTQAIDVHHLEDPIESMCPPLSARRASAHTGR